MNTHVCEICGRDPLVDSSTLLSRVNPLGLIPAQWRCQDCITKHDPGLLSAMSALVAGGFVRPCGTPNYPTHGPFINNPLPWRYDATTRNVLAVDGAVVLRVGDSVYGDPRIGELIVGVVNALGFTRPETNPKSAN